MNKKTVLLLVFVLALAVAIPASALDLVESNPQDGSKAFAVDSQIYLLFDKNVVNFQIKDNNLQCFTLFDPQNQSVPIEVILADDQIEPEKRNEIIIKPKTALKGNTAYRLEISPELQAKNGQTLEKKIVISFTTAN